MVGKVFMLGNNMGGKKETNNMKLTCQMQMLPNGTMFHRLVLGVKVGDIYSCKV